MTDTSKSAIRLDKWLWAARFYKTRSLAQQMIQGGKVHYNGQRVKPSRSVEIGALITLRIGYETTEVTVKVLSEKRRSASIAQTLYEETAASIEKKQRNQAARKAQPQFDAGRRPDKKQRRQRLRVKHGEQP